MKIIGLILCILVVTNLSIFQISHKQKEPIDHSRDKLNTSIVLDNRSFFSVEEKICLDFVLNNLSSPSGGIYTNYLETYKTSEYATGHEILSESVGLWMLYSLENNMKDEFEQQYILLEEKMINKDGLVKWRIREDNINMSNTSASIDDLRIIRGLLIAYSLWGQQEYLNTAIEISDNLLKYNVTKGILNNYKNPNSTVRADDIDLAYIDLYTMKLLSNYNSEWNPLYNSSMEIIEKGYISNKFPLYRKSYNIEKKDFIENNNINMIDTTIVLLHLSEVGEIKPESILWFKEQLRENKIIFSEYEKNTGVPTTKDQSTAVYAIIARIAKVIEDEELYDLAISNMLKLQVLEKDSSIYGSFGNTYDLKVFSFDNLLALLAFK